MVGDNRVRRWLSELCEETYDDQEEWMKLIKFLEKDLKVQQQKALIQEKSDEKRNNKQNLDSMQIGKNGAHFTNQCTDKKCYFCDRTDDHIAAAGPRETEIIQARNLLKRHQRKSFKSSEKKYIVLNVYSQEHHRALANTVMVNAKEISVAKVFREDLCFNSLGMLFHIFGLTTIFIIF